MTARTVVVGTAGHVDHGKSTLVKALTGTDPDRLAEEKARGMTIDLGFAHCALPGGATASFVDVPGHEDFIKNALAGAGGVDMALLVIAADEGPMPQTREHLAILDLLHLAHGVVAVTKADLVDADWLALVTDEIAALIAPTSLAGAPIVAVSAVSGRGIDDLRIAIEAQLDAVPPSLDRGRARLSVDRVFTMAGFGTVVTGTLRDGALATGDTVDIQPRGLTARIRGLQSHGKSVATAQPGTRTAVNLVGIEVTDIARGDDVTASGAYEPTQLIDAEVTILPDAAAPLRHDRVLHLFHGAAEVPAHARLIGGDEIAPGGRGHVQFWLTRPMVLAAGDRIVLRLASPSRTVGGGEVLDPHPSRRWRRFRETALARFDALTSGDPHAVVLQALAEREPCRADALAPADIGLSADERDAALAALAADGRAVRLGGGAPDIWMTADGWETLGERAQAVLAAHHAQQPLKRGLPPEELRMRLRLTSEAFTAVVDAAAADGRLARDGGVIRLSAHSVAFAPRDQAAVDALLGRFDDAPFAPPSYRDAIEAVGERVLEALIAQGRLVNVGADVLFSAAAFDALTAFVHAHLAEQPTLSVADLRDRFATSRKYALAFLEHLDRIRVTRRVGDARVLVGQGAGRAAEGRTGAGRKEATGHTEAET